MKWTLLVCISLICIAAFAQYPEKNWFDKRDSVYGYYVSIPPASGRVQGLLVLLDGYSGNADNFLSETKIHNVAWANDLLTICIPTGNRFYLDKSMMALLNRVLAETLQKTGLRKDQVAIGGMSSGGTIALRYAELCKEKPGEFPVQPAAVFDVDSPIDLADLYKSSERDLKKNNSGWWRGECQMIIDNFKKELGDPNTDFSRYQTVSPMLREASDSTNEKWLSSLAVRTYHDADISWHIQNRGRSLYETNMADGSELISCLVNVGNKRAEFMASAVQGRRSSGQRHPHSWNIVDEIELVQWLKNVLHFYPDHLAVPFAYTAPERWETETILFPMNFAPELPYKGFEELRFAPGWGSEASPEKWAYTIVWWLNDGYNFDEKILQRNIENYYTGLTKQRAIVDNPGLAGFIPTSARVQKVKTEKGDSQTFDASAHIFDAQVTKKPGNLYFKIHVRECSTKNNTIVLLEVAGTPYTGSVWPALDKINEDFKCAK